MTGQVITKAYKVTIERGQLITAIVMVMPDTTNLHTALLVPREPGVYEVGDVRVEVTGR